MKTVAPMPPKLQIRYVCKACAYAEPAALNLLGQAIDLLRGRNASARCPKCGGVMVMQAREIRNRFKVDGL